MRDVLDGLERAADIELSGVYDLGTGDASSFDTVVELINAELGTDVDPEYAENPIPEDVYVHDTCADASAFEAATGWSPQIGFEDGIEQVCSYYQ